MKIKIKHNKSKISVDVDFQFNSYIDVKSVVNGIISSTIESIDSDKTLTKH
jgi:hypothetical protein